MDFDSVATITCPACGPRSALTPRPDDPHTGVCSRCGGALATGESASLELLQQSLEWGQVVAFGRGSLGLCDCPLCGQRTTQLTLGGQAVEACTACELLWHPPKTHQSASAAPLPAAFDRRNSPAPGVVLDELDTAQVPFGRAAGALLGVLLFSAVLFLAPLAIDTKVYAFMVAAAVGAFLLGKTVRELDPTVDSGVGDNYFEAWYATLSLLGQISVVFTIGVVFWCGTVMFWQYWTPGGADPYFHDITVTYVAMLVPLLALWWVALFLKPTRGTLASVLRAFRFWVVGYGLVLGSMLVWVIFDD